jgi:sarcosine oxidase subunit beta
MSNEVSTDVVVIGAGIVGASCAQHLAEAGIRVSVVDSFDGPAEGSTGRCFASIRAQWADSLNIEMSWRSIKHFQSFEATYGIDVGYRPSGYLFLVPEDAWEAQQRAVQLQREHGVPVEAVSLDEASAITPFAHDGIAGATWGPSDGVVDPHLATSAYLKLARSNAASVHFGHTVTAVEADDASGGWLVHAGQRTFRTQYVVNAAGGWAGGVAALAGLHAPVVHSRRNIYATAPGALPKALPMTIDLGTGVYIRSEGSRLLFAAARSDEVDGYKTNVDWEWMEKVLERAVPRFPWLADLPLDRSACWAGTYENTPDHHGILGADPRAATWINACGFSGHGLMQAPEIGRLTAEQISTGSITSLDVTALSLNRFAAASTAHVGLVF